jgi:hypothetical protein
MLMHVDYFSIYPNKKNNVSFAKLHIDILDCYYYYIDSKTRNSDSWAHNSSDWIVDHLYQDLIDHQHPSSNLHRLI